MNLVDFVKPQFTKEECKNYNHWFVPYNASNMICMRCGRFAKVGHLERKESEVTNEQED